MAKGRARRVARMCGLCGEPNLTVSLYEHLVDVHEGEYKAMASLISRLVHKQLNRKTRRKAVSRG